VSFLDPELYTPANPLQTVAAVSPEQIWDRFGRFLNEILPVAEAAGVKLALHPDDPPLPFLRDTARLVHAADGYDHRLYACCNEGR